MVPYLILTAKTGESLLLRYPEKLLLVKMDHRFPERKLRTLTDRVLAYAELSKMGLRWQSFSPEQIREVQLGGMEKGAGVILVTGKKPLVFSMAEEADTERAQAVFAGLTCNVLEDRWKHRLDPSGWRDPDPEASRQIFSWGKLIPFANLAILLVLILLQQGKALFFGMLLESALELFLVIRYPRHFSLLRERHRGFHVPGAVGLWDFLVRPVVASAFLLMFFSFPDLGRLLLVMGLVWLVLIVGLVTLVPELRLNVPNTVAFCLLAVSLAFSVTAWGNHALNTHVDQIVQAPVVETYKSTAGRGGTSYHAVVELPGAGETKLRIRKSEYEGLQPGDRIEVFFGEGAFGIGYAYSVNMLP